MDLLMSLVNHSLVRQHEDESGDVRFRMLQTIRDYANELLHRSPEHRTLLRERHAKHFLALADHVMTGDAYTPDAPQLGSDRDNLRAALTFWLDDAPASDGKARINALRLAANLGVYWYHRGLAREGTGWLERALSAANDPPPEVEALALRMLGVLMETQREYDRAIELFETALEKSLAIGDRAGEAACLNSLGVTARSSGAAEGAEDFFERALRIRRELGDKNGLVSTQNNLGIVYTDQGRFDEARSLFTGNLVLDRQNGDKWGAAITELNLSAVSLLEGDAERACTTAVHALRAVVAVGDLDAQAEALEVCLGVATAQGRWTLAARLAGASDAFRASIGVPSAPADRVRLDRWIGACRENLDRADFDAAWREGSLMTTDQATSYALSEVCPD
jgi:tetratricopeptide (TPR) repeat protein